MNRSLKALPLALMLAAGFGPTLKAQALLVQAKVSTALPAYTPKVQVKGTLEIPGTDALSDLGEEWSKAFQKFHGEGRMVYLPKLSKEAIKELVDGTRNLIVSARELSPEEMNQFRAKFGYMPMRIPVCLDANIVFVHKNNPVSSISMAQLDAIYSKDRKAGAKEPIFTWGDLGVGGELSKRPINAYSREEGSALRSTFANAALLGGDFRPGILVRGDSSSLAEAVLTDLSAISFGPMSSWYSTNKILPVVPHQGSDARYPTQDTVTSSRYPMAMLYYAYLNRAPGQPLDPMVNEFMHFVLARDGQTCVAESSLFPGPVEFLTIALKRLDR